MYGLLREEHSLGSQASTKILARHLYTRTRCGRVVIITDNPISLHSALRRQWLKLSRKVFKEQASTLNAQRIQELSNVVCFMQNLIFSTDWPPDDNAGVYIISPYQVLRYAPDCRTMYVTCKMELEDIHKATAWMDRKSLVVLCTLA